MPELVPRTLWGRSACKMLGGKAVWRKQIRVDALASANNCCSMCKSSEGRMLCHEKWRYDDKRSTATLLGFEIHCSNCDLVAHAGRAFRLGHGEVVISHICTVNGWEPERANAVIEEARDVWVERSKKNWKITVPTFLLNRYPELAALPMFNPPPGAFLTVTPLALHSCALMEL